MTVRSHQADGEMEPRGRAARAFRWGRLLPLALLLAGGAVAWWGLGLDEHLSFAMLRDNREQIIDYVAAHRLLSAALFVLVYTVVTAFSLPVGSLLTVAGGFLFGLLAGTFLVVVAATLGATAVFLAARTAAGERLLAQTQGWLGRVEDGFRRDAFSYLLVLRLIPLFPFWLVNLLPAAVGVSTLTFVLATAIGIVPGTLIYASLGGGVGAILEEGGNPDLSLFVDPALLAPLFGLALLALLPVAWRRYRAGRGRP